MIENVCSRYNVFREISRGVFLVSKHRGERRIDMVYIGLYDDIEYGILERFVGDDFDDKEETDGDATQNSTQQR